MIVLISFIMFFALVSGFDWSRRNRNKKHCIAHGHEWADVDGKLECNRCFVKAR